MPLFAYIPIKKFPQKHYRNVFHEFLFLPNKFNFLTHCLYWNCCIVPRNFRILALSFLTFLSLIVENLSILFYNLYLTKLNEQSEIKTFENLQQQPSFYSTSQLLKLFMALLRSHLSKYDLLTCRYIKLIYLLMLVLQEPLKES